MDWVLLTVLLEIREPLTPDGRAEVVPVLRALETSRALGIPMALAGAIPFRICLFLAKAGLITSTSSVFEVDCCCVEWRELISLEMRLSF